MLSDIPHPPRIGYVVKVYPRFSETFIVTEILAREAQGESIEIFSLRPTDDTRFHAELARVQAPVRAIPVPKRMNIAWSGLRAAAADPVLQESIARHLPELTALEPDDALQAIEVARQVRLRGITHLHAHFASVATTVARMASRLTGVPYSFTAHAKDIFHESVSHDDLELKFADAAFAVTVSDYNLAHLRAEFGDRHPVHRVYNGLDLDRFPFSPRPARGTPLRLLAVGRLVEKKGFSLLVTAVERVHAAGVPVTLDIVGDGELSATLSAQISASPARERIRMLGPLPQHEVARCLREADVFVAPCLVGGDGNADGLPTVLLEAMASGLPCVSTAVTGIPEVVRDGDTGVLCAPGDVDALTAALLRVASDDFPADSIARRARDLIEREFDARRLAGDLAALTAGVASDERKAA
ncbi:glycosyltransferase [Agromyces atrinae]|uniref:glycosyltransferase n=1 Tax=Agromyces atrinae TaxID=592376 RepID=UPI001F58D622|nr:glycosyltransferase [Agromyces atrinae]MCI2956222.1 glycosyltransferase [Agromyces atrinae]